MIPLASIVNRNTFDSQESTETAVDGILSARSTVSQEESGNPPPATRASNKSKTENVPAGYPKLAQRMGFVPEMAVFRRFAYLNKLNLLHLQAELVEIESRLKEIQRRDNESPELEQLYAKDWYFLENSSAEGNNEQLNLLLNAREKLERYSMHPTSRLHCLTLITNRHGAHSTVIYPSHEKAKQAGSEQHTEFHRLRRDGSIWAQRPRFRGLGQHPRAH